MEKQVVLFLVSTRTVKRICNLISAEKATFQREKCLAMLQKEWTISSVRPTNSGHGPFLKYARAKRAISSAICWLFPFPTPG